MKTNISYLTIKPRHCVSVILSGLFSMYFYQSPKLFTLTIWYFKAIALEHEL